MSLREVSTAIRDLQIDDERIQSSGHCRYAAKRMKEVAKERDLTPPHTKIEIVAWRPKDAPIPEENVHFALRVRSGRERLVFNPVHTAGFPRYIGLLENAPGLLRKMRPTNELDKVNSGK